MDVQSLRQGRGGATARHLGLRDRQRRVSIDRFLRTSGAAQSARRERQGKPPLCVARCRRGSPAMPVARPKQGKVPVAELVSQVAKGAHRVLADRRVFRANAVLDRTMATRRDSSVTAMPPVVGASPPPPGRSHDERRAGWLLIAIGPPFLSPREAADLPNAAGPLRRVAGGWAVRQVSGTERRPGRVRRRAARRGR